MLFDRPAGAVERGGVGRLVGVALLALLRGACGQVQGARCGVGKVVGWLLRVLA